MTESNGYTPRVIVMVAWAKVGMSNQDLAQALLVEDITDVSVFDRDDYEHQIAEIVDKMRDFLEENRTAISVGLRYVNGPAGEKEFDSLLREIEAE